MDIGDIKGVYGVMGRMGGVIAQLVSCSPLMLGIQVRILVGVWLGSPNACMGGEEITSCKNYIASVSLTDWCIMIFIKRKKDEKKRKDDSRESRDSDR